MWFYPESFVLPSFVFQNTKEIEEFGIKSHVQWKRFLTMNWLIVYTHWTPNDRSDPGQGCRGCTCPPGRIVIPCFTKYFYKITLVFYVYSKVHHILKMMHPLLDETWISPCQSPCICVTGWPKAYISQSEFPCHIILFQSTEMVTH